MAYEQKDLPYLPDLDWEMYPNAVMEVCYDPGSDQWRSLRLHYSGAPFVAQEDGRICYGESTGRYRAYETTWGDEVTVEPAPVLRAGADGTGYCRLWTKTQICCMDGTVFLPENGITHPGWEGLTSWLTGLAIGLAGIIAPGR